MKQIITLCMLILSSVAYSQTVTIDYEAWNPSNPPCRIFPGNTNVPATGATGGTIQHITSAGQPFYSTSDKSIQIQTVYVSGGAGTWKGGSYRIYYNFKDGYSYTIYVTAAAVENTVGNQFGPYFRLDVDNMTGGLASNAPCNGAEQVTQNLSGNPAAQKLSDNAMTEFQFIMPALGTQSTLNITAIPAENGGTKTVRIRKIRIEETPPPVSFTLPGITTFTCGNTTAINRTVTNVYGTTGVTNYTWNLGAIPNGWLYNNVAAPATVSTGTTGSINITPVCNTVPKNISATVTANGNTYSTNTSTVSVSQPSMSINGVSSFCTGSQSYSITPLPCNATVSWSVTPTGIVTPTTSTATSPSFTQTGNGNITISATVTSCGTAQPTITKAVKVGGFTSADYTMTGGNSSTQPLYWCPNQTYGFQ